MLKHCFLTILLAALFTSSGGECRGLAFAREVECDCASKDTPQPETKYHVGNMYGTALSKVLPKYPEKALRERIDGRIWLEIVVDEQGSVVYARAIGGPDILRENARLAVCGYKFHPVKLEGVVIRVTGQIYVDFVLPDGIHKQPARPN